MQENLVVVYILLGIIIVVFLSICVILHATTHIIVHLCDFLILFFLCTSLTFLIIMLPLSWDYSVASFLFVLFALYSYTIFLIRKTFIYKEFHFSIISSIYLSPPLISSQNLFSVMTGSRQICPLHCNSLVCSKNNYYDEGYKP